MKHFPETVVARSGRRVHRQSCVPMLVVAVLLIGVATGAGAAVVPASPVRGTSQVSVLSYALRETGVSEASDVPHALDGSRKPAASAASPECNPSGMPTGSNPSADGAGLSILVTRGAVSVASTCDLSRVPAQELPPGIVERDTIVPGPIPLPATITLPIGKGPFRGVVLVHSGTGDGDRDETVGEIRPFRDIAWGLAQRGIVVLRYEKRSRVEPSWFARAGFTVFDETVQDAVAAARLLRKQVELDAKHIYVAGHGLGGIVAPRIALTEGDLAGLIIMAGATQVHLADQMEQQLNFRVTAAGADSFKVRYQLQPIRPLINRIRTLSDKDSFDIQPIAGLGGTSPKYWLDLNNPDPASLVRQLKLPILVLQGLKDYQMPPEGLDGWLRAVGDRKNIVVKRYPGLSHLFTTSDGVPGPNDYATPRLVDTTVITDIAEWIRKS